MTYEWEKECKEEFVRKYSGLWTELTTWGRRIERGLTHGMTDGQVNIILSLFDFAPKFKKQIEWDLKKARYKLWDWLAMCLMCRTRGYGQPKEIEDKAHELAVKLAKIYVDCAKKVWEKREGRSPEELRKMLYSCFFDKVVVLPEYHEVSERTVRVFTKVLAKVMLGMIAVLCVSSMLGGVVSESR